MPITLNEAVEMLGAARAKAEEIGRRMTFAVVDEAGHVVALHRMEGASWFNVDVVPAAAFTSVAFRRSGAELLQTQERPYFKAWAAMQGGRALADKGSVLLKRGDQIMGAVAAGGASEDMDLEVAKAAAALFESKG